LTLLSRQSDPVGCNASFGRAGLLARLNRFLANALLGDTTRLLVVN
jgi:hypothetical protein